MNEMCIFKDIQTALQWVKWILKRLFSKDTGLGRWLFGYDIIKVTEILKPTQLNNSWGDRRNKTSF